MLISVCISVAFDNRFDLFVYSFLGSAMGAYWIQDCRERKVLAKAGLRLGLLNMLLAGAIGMHVGDISGLSFLWDLAFGFLGGLGAGGLNRRVGAFVRNIFRLRHGHHSAGACQSGTAYIEKADDRSAGNIPPFCGHRFAGGSRRCGNRRKSLLAKVCGYFHDIGKVKKPLYFIENQRRSKNLHDKLAPSMSRRILIAHVKDGVEVAAEKQAAQSRTGCHTAAPWNEHHSIFLRQGRQAARRQVRERGGLPIPRSQALDQGGRLGHARRRVRSRVEDPG